MLGVEFAILLMCIIFGARLGGIALGTVPAVGLAILVFACGRPPGPLPLEVIRIVLCVICAAAALEAAGGLDWLVHVAERLLRERPHAITLVAPLAAYGFTFLAGTGHVTYALLPVIVDVAHQAGVRPERPLSIAVIASQQAIPASPLSAATAGMVALLAQQQSALGLRDILLICMPATLLGVVAGALAVWRMGPDLADDPGYLHRLREGKVKQSGPPRAALASTFAARWSVGLFLAASVAIMVLGIFPAWRPDFSVQGNFTRLDMVDTISILMLAASASIMVATKASPYAIMAGRVMSAGIVAAVAILGMAWLGSTFFAAHEAAIVDAVAGTVRREPWLFALGLFVLSSLLYSQAATVTAFMPVGVELGLPLPLLLGMLPAVSGYFLLPTYGTVVAAINFDHTGTTTAGRYLLDHSFMRPGLVATSVAVATGVVIVKVFY